jgi:cation:H+ antiporter
LGGISDDSGTCCNLHDLTHIFAQLETIGPWRGMSAQLVALLFSPIATQMPETMNAIIWVRQGKECMAFYNLSGAI